MRVREKKGVKWKIGDKRMIVVKVSGHG